MVKRKYLGKYNILLSNTFLYKKTYLLEWGKKVILSLAITWIFWIIIIIIDIIIHPGEWYLFFIPPIILSVLFVLISCFSNTLSAISSFLIHLIIIINLIKSYKNK